MLGSLRIHHADVKQEPRGGRGEDAGAFVRSKEVSHRGDFLLGVLRLGNDCQQFVQGLGLA
jgi:hypothetical protein